MSLKKILFGTAYYYEYLPYDRLDKDIEMMKAAHINVVRIGESTWGTYEYQDGKFDFSSLDKVLEAMGKAKIDVIVGTPTYAIPNWLAKEHPEVMVQVDGKRVPYGPRQKMDITNPIFLKYAERIIRRMLSHVCKYPAIIGYQIDNETKYYGTSSKNVQLKFREYLFNKYHGDLVKFNQDFGLAYWSNQVNSWGDLPSMDGSINGSLNAEFDKFRRSLVTDYLKWQRNIVDEYRKPNQFITHNFDFGWRGYSYGIRPEVDHFDASEALDYTGIDIYHPARTQLTGAELSFAGDEARTTKGKNYLILETQAQAYKQQVPFPGQARLLAYSHIASGAGMIEYWHWHSIHNSFETYWKGILGHDFQPNPVYSEIAKTGAELERLSPELIDLKIHSDVAFLVSNQSLTGIQQFPYSQNRNYNDVFRTLYDEFYKLNIRTDLVDEKHIDLYKYKLIVVPLLYSASDEFLQELNKYVEQGGHVIYTFKSGFSDEQLKVRDTVQPGIIHEACGMHYELFVNPEPDNCKLKTISDWFCKSDDLSITDWMELIIPDGAEVLAKYDNANWSEYAAITKNNFGKGSSIYIGCYPSRDILRDLIKSYVDEIGFRLLPEKFPIVVKNVTNKNGVKLTFYLNFSGQSQNVTSPVHGIELIENYVVKNAINLSPWGVAIVKEEK